MPDFETVVKLLGAVVCVAGILLCVRLATFRARPVPLASNSGIGFLGLGALAAYKVWALAGLVLVPLAGIGLANYHVFEGTHETRSCLSCHIMRPMGNDMFDPESQNLAAVHYRNKWIPEQTCYHCHADYGLGGNLAAKGDGFRHLARYTTGLYEEPIRGRRPFNNQNCLACHADTEVFETVSPHQTVSAYLETSEMSCLNCHGQAHPSPAQRTPGSEDYAGLMRALNR